MAAASMTTTPTATMATQHAQRPVATPPPRPPAKNRSPSHSPSAQPDRIGGSGLRQDVGGTHPVLAAPCRLSGRRPYRGRPRPPTCGRGAKGGATSRPPLPSGRATASSGRLLHRPAARQTVDLLASALGDVEIIFDAGLYEADAADLLRRIQRAPAEAAAVMVVGHNPGLHVLALELTESAGDDDPRLGGFPPGALACITAPTGWSDLRPG